MEETDVVRIEGDWEKRVGVQRQLVWTETAGEEEENNNSIYKNNFKGTSPKK